MSDIKLFRLAGSAAEEIRGGAAQSEKELHRLIERNMETMFGIRFVAREHSTGKWRRGQIDSLGLDCDGSPVILEYKRAFNENVICQGLFYMDWLMDHKAEFILLVHESLGADAAGEVDFASPRLICVASVFSRFDEAAVRQINRDIELVRYKLFDGDLLLLELINEGIPAFAANPDEDGVSAEDSPQGMPASMRERINGMNDEAERLYLELLAFAESLGEDVSIKFLKHYIALSRLRNFTCVQPLRSSLKLWLNLDPGEIDLEEGFSRDVRAIGHVGSGNLEVDICDDSGLARVKPLIEMAYQKN